MNSALLVVLFFGFFISAFLGYYIAKQKGRDTTEGVLFGLFLGILGLIILGLLPNKTKSRNSSSTSEPPSQRAIQKADDNDFFGKIVGVILLIGFIYLIYWAFNN